MTSANIARIMRNAWITVANRCEFLDVPDVTEK